MNSQRIGSRIKQARQARSVKRIELAVAVGVTSNTIRNYEEGLTRIDADVLARISLALEADERWLLHGDAVKEEVA